MEVLALSIFVLVSIVFFVVRIYVAVKEDKEIIKEQPKKENDMIVGQLAYAIEKVLEAKKKFDATEPGLYNYSEERQEYFDLEAAENELIHVIKKNASQEDE